MGREFQRQHPCPSTGKASGRRPGYVVDDVVPLKRGGADVSSNMQWQTKGAAAAGDAIQVGPGRSLRVILEVESARLLFPAISLATTMDGGPLLSRMACATMANIRRKWQNARTSLPTALWRRSNSRCCGSNYPR
jgi:hypothetical protein